MTKMTSLSRVQVCLFLIWLTVYCFFPDVVDSRFPELVDNLLETLTPLLKSLSFVFRCYKICKKKIFFAKTFENRNAAAVPLQRQSERRKFALLQEKNYGPTRETKFAQNKTHEVRCMRCDV